MVDSHQLKSSRRQFLGGIGALCAVNASWSHATPAPSSSSYLDLIRPPDCVLSYETDKPVDLAKSGSAFWDGDGISVEVKQSRPGQLSVSLTAQKPVSRLHLRWRVTVHAALHVMGDAWERAYGDLEWRGIVGQRVMPWYFLTYDGQRAHGYGVATGPSAMCFWRVDSAGVSLWLDVRNGGSPVQLGDRKLEVATIVTREGQEGETPWQSTRSFVKLLCPKPRLPKAALYGGNNWYYAYGENCSARDIERDAAFIAELCGPEVNRPFQVIDEGWELVSWGAGPWRYGNAGFPDMAGLAARLKAIGVRPGIWMRPLLSRERGLESWTLKKPGGGEEGVLDPTIPEVRDHIRGDVAGLVAWGYELVKHDFSTADLFGRWGSGMGSSVTDGGWSFHDRSRTTAEVLRDFYNAIREGAGDETLIIGCNTVGHLAAGVFDAQRVGDDTSGREWDRTRRMGVNALAFRGVQHGALFAADADCVGITKDIPWELNERWLRLLSRSGTPLFVSANPTQLTREQRDTLRDALRRAASDQPVGEPLDWMETTTPERWRFGSEEMIFDWYGPTGETTL